MIFDLDDTLSDHLHCARAGLEALRSAHPGFAAVSIEELESAYSESLERLHLEMLDGRITQAEARIERMQDLFAFVGIEIEGDAAAAEYRSMRAAYDAAARTVRGSHELLDALTERGVRLAVITNNLVAEQEEKLARLDLDRYFEVVTISEGVGVSKPAREIFELTLAELEIGVDDAVMIGDSLTSDIAGAVGVGMRAVWLDRHDAVAHSEVELSPRVRRLAVDLADTDAALAMILQGGTA